MDRVNKILKEKCKDKNISWCYQKVTNSSWVPLLVLTRCLSMLGVLQLRIKQLNLWTICLIPLMMTCLFFSNWGLQKY